MHAALSAVYTHFMCQHTQYLHTHDLILSQALLAVLLQGGRCSAAGGGEAKVPLLVRRQHAFWDALRCALAAGVVPPAADIGTDGAAGGGAQQRRCAAGGGGGPCKLFPRFEDAAAAAAAGAAGAVAAEAGEGHGPRKELFLLAGEDLIRPPPDESEELREPQLLGNGGAQRCSGSSACAQRRRGSAGGSDSSSELCALFEPLRASGAIWFNPRLPASGAAARAYWFAGWLLGQALPNRAHVGVQFAAALFDRLAAGADYKVRALYLHGIFRISNYHACCQAHTPTASNLASVKCQLPHTNTLFTTHAPPHPHAHKRTQTHARTQPTLDDLQRHDPEAAAPLRRLLSSPAGEITRLAALDGLPAGTSAQQYVTGAVTRLLVDDVQWHYSALEQGFLAAGLSREVSLCAVLFVQLHLIMNMFMWSKHACGWPAHVLARWDAACARADSWALTPPAAAAHLLPRRRRARGRVLRRRRAGAAHWRRAAACLQDCSGGG